MKIKHQVLLLFSAIVSFLFGIYLVISPWVEHTKQYSQKNALLQSMEHGDGRIPIDTAVTDADMDLYGEMCPSTTWDNSPPQADEPATVQGIGILSIERIGLRLPVVEGVSPAQLNITVGWIPQTAAIGETGNAVIAGHRSYVYGKLFNRLEELAPGDIIRYTSREGMHSEFTVTEILEVEPGAPSALQQPQNVRRLTLYTCTPIQTAERRLLIRAERTT